MIDKQFSITSLTVHNVPHSVGAERLFITNAYKKNLAEDTYYFNMWENNESSYIREFFGKNISVQAIVGKNGCGKSTLIDIIIKLINNLSFCLYSSEPKDNALQEQYPLRYVRGVFAEMRFVKGGEIGKIVCEDRITRYHYGKLKYEWDALDPRRNGSDLPRSEEIEIALSLFYSLIINYSIHSFNEEVYEKDYCYGGDSKCAWIKGLFHKNDGYRIPINLNPFRSSASINMIHENQLNDSRLVAILINAEEHHQQFLEGYGVHSIDYYFTPEHLIDKFSASDLPSDAPQMELKHYPSDKYNVLYHFKKAIESRDSYASLILERFGYCYCGEFEDNLIVLCYLYIVYKVLNIIATYPSYRVSLDDRSTDSSSANWGKSIMKMAFSSVGDALNGRIWDKIQEEKVLERMVKDSSHITLKIRQIQNFLKVYRPKTSTADMLLNNGPIDYKTYFACLGVRYESMSMDELISWFPPALFTPSILLDKYTENTNKNGEKELKNQNDRPIEIRSLSSGELQYIHTLSTIVYHVRNLLSVNGQDREKYDCINIMMDEVEMCFHPDYQRGLISKLLFTITSLGLNQECGFNIILATHSPFVLSDIPKSNVLYLKDGKCVNDSIKFSPFAANVNDTLKQSFFLDNGFIGEFAKKKVQSLCDYIEFLKDGKRSRQNDKMWTDENVERFIGEIGDPLMRETLYSAWVQARFKDERYREYDWQRRKLNDFWHENDSIN